MQIKGRLNRPFRVSKKWPNATFLSFTGFASRIRYRAAKPAKYENLRVFILSDAHPPGGLLLPLRGNSPCVVRAGLNIRALINPRVFRQTESGFKPLFYLLSFPLFYLLSFVVYGFYLVSSPSHYDNGRCAAYAHKQAQHPTYRHYFRKQSGEELPQQGDYGGQHQEGTVESALAIIGNI